MGLGCRAFPQRRHGTQQSREHAGAAVGGRRGAAAVPAWGAHTRRGSRRAQHPHIGAPQSRTAGARGLGPCRSGPGKVDREAAVVPGRDGSPWPRGLRQGRVSRLLLAPGLWAAPGACAPLTPPPFPAVAVRFPRSPASEDSKVRQCPSPTPSHQAANQASAPQPTNPERGSRTRLREALFSGRGDPRGLRPGLGRCPGATVLSCVFSRPI